MTKHVEFIPCSKEAALLVSPPKPAKLYIPDWYKKIPPMKKPEFAENGEAINKTVKNCMPFLDALTHGYIQETWTDIYIEVNGKNIKYYYGTKPDIMTYREKSYFSVSDVYYPVEFVWKEPWIPKMPKGYSVLYTQPFNNFNLPFRSLDAVIDADYYHHTYAGQYPFYIYKGFSGLIPAGTPMYQIIPIKRESWESHILTYDEEQNMINNNMLKKHMFNSYKKLFWQRKSFK